MVGLRRADYYLRHKMQNPHRQILLLDNTSPQKSEHILRLQVPSMNLDSKYLHDLDGLLLAILWRPQRIRR